MGNLELCHTRFVLYGAVPAADTYRKVKSRRLGKPREVVDMLMRPSHLTQSHVRMLQTLGKPGVEVSYRTVNPHS